MAKHLCKECGGTCSGGPSGKCRKCVRKHLRNVSQRQIVDRWRQERRDKAADAFRPLISGES